ncbi:MAG TPA: cytochrome c biogenesis protein CcdA [Jatrophihabitantaceae bacterium]|jgi:hypothetical protein|nr:cytochrome c biogenesis protein CcdA [Jatrophihabitantaceae bacterium]
MVAGAFLFALGFSAIFVSGGVLFGRLGAMLREHQTAANRIFGLVAMVFGLIFIGKVAFPQREMRIHRLPPAGLRGAALLGAASGFDWGPASRRRSARSTSCHNRPALRAVAHSYRSVIASAWESHSFSSPWD